MNVRVAQELRREHSALRGGRLVDLFYDDDAYAYVRQDSKETMIIAINRSAGDKRLAVPVKSVGLADGVELIPIAGLEKSIVVSGSAILKIPAQTAVAFLAASVGEKRR